MPALGDRMVAHERSLVSDRKVKDVGRNGFGRPEAETSIHDFKFEDGNTYTRRDGGGGRHTRSRSPAVSGHPKHGRRQTSSTPPVRLPKIRASSEGDTMQTQMQMRQSIASTGATSQQSYALNHSDSALLHDSETLAGDTAALTMSHSSILNNSSLGSTFRPFRGQNRGAGSFFHVTRRNSLESSGGDSANVLTSVLRLQQEELTDGLGSALIKRGIVDARRKKRPLQMWKTPFEVDPPRALVRFPSQESLVSSDATKSAIMSMNPEERIWHGIAALMHEAFNDDDFTASCASVSKAKSLAIEVESPEDLLPEKLVRAVSRKSLLSDYRGEKRKSDVFTEQKMKNALPTEDLDEIEMAQVALNSFMDFLLPVDENEVPTASPEHLRRLAEGDIEREHSTPELIQPDSESTHSANKEEGFDQIALAEVALNSFMDLLLDGLENDLRQDINHPPENETDESIRRMRQRKTDSTLTLFELFQWSLRVNIDAQERLIREAQKTLKPSSEKARARQQEQKVKKLAERFDSFEKGKVEHPEAKVHIPQTQKSTPKTETVAKPKVESQRQLSDKQLSKQQSNPSVAEERKSARRLLDGLKSELPIRSGENFPDQNPPTADQRETLEKGPPLSRSNSSGVPSFVGSNPLWKGEEGRLSRGNSGNVKTPEPKLPDNTPQWANLFGMPVVMTQEAGDAGTPDSPATNVLPSSFHEHETGFLNNRHSARSLRTFNSAKSPLSDDGMRVPSVVGPPMRPIVTVQEDDYEDMPELVDFDDETTLASTLASRSNSSASKTKLPSIKEGSRDLRGSVKETTSKGTSSKDAGSRGARGYSKGNIPSNREERQGADQGENPIQPSSRRGSSKQPHESNRRSSRDDGGRDGKGGAQRSSKPHVETENRTGDLAGRTSFSRPRYIPEMIPETDGVLPDDMKTFGTRRSPKNVLLGDISSRSDVQIGSVIEIDSSLSGSFQGRFFKTSAAEDDITIDSVLHSIEDRRRSAAGFEPRGWFCQPRALRDTLISILPSRGRRDRMITSESVVSGVDNTYASYGGSTRRNSSARRLLHGGGGPYDRTNILTHTTLDIDENGFVLAA